MHTDSRSGGQGERIVTFLLHLLETEENEKIQALLCMGIAKLMLAGMITDERVSGLRPFGGPVNANLAVV